MTQQDSSTVAKQVTVAAPIELAFEVFTSRFGDFKPPEQNLLAVPIAETVFEPYVGGHIYDRGVDGGRCPWARVLAFEPPHRVVFSWDIDPQWHLETDPENTSEVEVRFIPDGPGHTRVELEHRNIDRHGPGWDSVRRGIAGEAGWPLYLSRYAALLAGTGPDEQPPTQPEPTLERYERAQDVFDQVVAALPANEWDRPSACAEWTRRDVLGHVIWGQELVRHLAIGRRYESRLGAPGASNPGRLAANDPVVTWRAARHASNATLSAETLARTVTLHGKGDVPLDTFVTALTTDFLAHAWDIGAPAGIDVRFDPQLLPGCLDWASANVVPGPGMFGPALSAPDRAGSQERLLAILGRDTRPPDPAVHSC